MAVSKSRTTRSRRGKRRAHDALTTTTLSIDAMTGELHRRHHLTADGFYRGRAVIKKVEKRSVKKSEVESIDE